MSKFIMIVFLSLSCVGLIKAQEIVDSYIEAFQYIAVSEMERTGIPASIKLAQGLLESNWGRSELSTFAHNHFGIKCGSKWEGETYYRVDDDRDAQGNLRESCFRVFESDEASYIAHSEFLLSNKRYAFLFDYSDTDYKAWAKGLRKAGYATDPNYPSKLIGVIKKYQLSRFDYMAPEELELLAEAGKNTSEDIASVDQAELDFMSETLNDLEEPRAEVAENSMAEGGVEKTEKKRNFWTEATKDTDFTKNYVKYKRKWENNAKKAKEDAVAERTGNRFNFDNLLAEVVDLGNSVLKDDEKEGPTSFPDLEEHNGVKMILAEGGESLQDVSARTGIHVNQLYQFNDKAYKIKDRLLDKTIIYLEPKKSNFSGSRETHEVRHGEKIKDIAQRYAVTEKSIRKRNYLKDNEELRHGEIVYLKGIRTARKPKLAKSRSNTKDSFTFVEK